MKRVVVFDLYDTVLKDISFDFENGLATQGGYSLGKVENCLPCTRTKCEGRLFFRLLILSM